MNIQIFGSVKSRDTKKAQMFFKERRIPFSFNDMKKRELSRGEFFSVLDAVGGMENMVDNKNKDKELLTLLKYMTAEDAQEKLFENQFLLMLPIVRSGKKATVGYKPEIWKEWLE